MWMENGKNNKIKEQFKAEMSTTDHTLLPGSPAVHLVSLCLICGHLWCALSLSSHLVSPCAPAASTGHHSRTFSPHARCQATGLACRRRRCREAASQSPLQVPIRISVGCIQTVPQQHHTAPGSSYYCRPAKWDKNLP